MLRNPIVTAFLFCICVLLVNLTSAQCLTAPPLDPCDGSEPLLTDNETLNSGVKKWYYGSVASYNSLTLRGGTLIVCGNLSIDKFTMDSGTVIIRPGARFVVGTGIGYGLVLKGNCAIYNHGIFECRRNITLDWPFPGVTQPNIIMNVSASSVFDAQFVYFGISSPNSFFVNNGKAQFHGVTTDPAASTNSVCLAGGSEMRMNVLYNRARLPYNVFGGQACVQVTTYSQFYDTLTRNPNVYVCVGSTHASDASCTPWGCRPNAWGTTSLFQNCNICPELNVLPIGLYDFKVKQFDQFNSVSWKTDVSPEAYIQYVEKSHNGYDFARIDSVTNFASVLKPSFEKKDYNIKEGNSYYRVRSEHRQSGQSFSTPVLKVTKTGGLIVRLHGNPVRSRILLDASKSLKQATLVNTQGVVVLTQTYVTPELTSYELRLPAAIKPGLYWLKLQFEKETIVQRVFVE